MYFIYYVLIFYYCYTLKIITLQLIINLIHLININIVDKVIYIDN